MTKNMIRLEELTSEFDSVKNRKTIMHEFGDIENSVTGINEDGEDIILSINPKNIICIF